MKLNQPKPQGEHLNTRKILFGSVGLFVALIAIYSFSSVFTGTENKNNNKRYNTGAAKFLNRGITGNSGVFGDSPINSSFVPPAPDTLFNDTKEFFAGRSLPHYEKNQPQPLPQPRQTYYRNAPQPTPQPTHSQPSTEENEFEEAQNSVGVIYSTLNSKNSNRTSYSNKRSTRSPYDVRNPYRHPQRGQPFFRHAQHGQISNYMKEPKTPYTLMEGYLIPATLETSINSDLPGDVRAFVTQDIYDSIQMKYLLIPKGTVLIGSYDERVMINQDKLLISWERMIFPDGRSISLPKLMSYDLQGRSGLTGDVNSHFWKIFGQSAFISLIGAGISTSLPHQRGFYRQPSAGSVMAQHIARSFNKVATQVLQRNLNMAPTIHIPGGTQFYIYLAGDISFQQPYEYNPPTPQ